MDQSLMRGGSVVVAGGQYVLSPLQYGGGILMDPVQEGLEEMLDSYGIDVTQSMVLDPQNQPFPIQVQRNVGGFNVVEMQQMDYPLFVDVRRDGLATDSPAVADLPALTLQWVSPVEIDAEKNQDREVVTLAKSTDESWLRDSGDVQPNLDLYPDLGFPVEGVQASYPLAVSVSGVFDSYFQDRPSPFEPSEMESTGDQPEATSIPEEEALSPVLGTIEQSPESSRLVVIGSSEFIDDIVLDLAASVSAERHLLNLQFMQNVVDWAVEDADLLEIRSRGSFTHLLEPLEEGEQSFWEGVNYAGALLAVVVIGIVWNLRRRSEAPMSLDSIEPEPGRDAEKFEGRSEIGGEK
jgi:ABC-2 type transport system permease protein